MWDGSVLNCEQILLSIYHTAGFAGRSRPLCRNITYNAAMPRPSAWRRSLWYMGVIREYPWEAPPPPQVGGFEQEEVFFPSPSRALLSPRASSPLRSPSPSQTPLAQIPQPRTPEAVSSTNSLPTRRQWQMNELNVLVECNLCFEEFYNHPGHAPARFIGPNSCNHVFGSSCLKRWVDSGNANANKCPNCRRVLFRHEGDVEENNVEITQVVQESLDSHPMDAPQVGRNLNLDPYGNSRPRNNESAAQIQHFLLPHPPYPTTTLSAPQGDQPVGFVDLDEIQLHEAGPDGSLPAPRTSQRRAIVYSNRPFTLLYTEEE
jgi:hypothetical protein